MVMADPEDRRVVVSVVEVQHIDGLDDPVADLLVDPLIDFAEL